MKIAEKSASSVLKDFLVYLNLEEILKLLTIPKLHKKFSCYIIEIVDDHGCCVVEYDANASLSADVRGDYDHENDDEGVDAEEDLNKESEHKEIEVNPVEPFPLNRRFVSGNLKLKVRLANLLDKEHKRKSQKQIAQYLV